MERVAPEIGTDTGWEIRRQSRLEMPAGADAPDARALSPRARAAQSLIGADNCEIRAGSRVPTRVLDAEPSSLDAFHVR